jgi:hypothetical protein
MGRTEHIRTRCGLDKIFVVATDRVYARAPKPSWPTLEELGLGSEICGGEDADGARNGVISPGMIASAIATAAPPRTSMSS